METAILPDPTIVQIALYRFASLGPGDALATPNPQSLPAR